MKKAQLSIFTIVGLIVVLLVVGAFFLRDINIERSGGFKITSRPVLTGTEAQVNDFVEDCIKDVARANLRVIGQQGGYFNAVSTSTDFNVPYYVDKGQNLVPVKERVETEIADSINEGLPLCVNNFESFTKLRIEAGNVDTKVNLNEEEVALLADYPLKIWKEEELFKLDDFYVAIPVRYGKMYEVTEKIMEDQLQNPDSVCINCYVTEALKNDFYYKVQRYGDDVVVFTMIDFNDTRTHMPFNLTYAVRY